MSFKIKIRGTDHEFTCEQGESLIDAAARQNIDIPFSCQSGICQTCKGHIYSGDYNYGDIEPMVELDASQAEALLCCAQPKSDLVIDHPDLYVPDAPKTQHASLTIVEKKKQDEQLLLVTLTKGPIRFFAGQYLELLINNKAYPYSIASSPDNAEIELHIQFSPAHPGSMIVANYILEQNHVKLNAPLGGAYLRQHSSRPILLVAGGTGIAPHKSMIEYLVQHNSKREIYLYWGARQPELLYLQEHYVKLSQIMKNFHYVPVISGVNDDWHGRKGLVHQAALEDFNDMSKFDIYICGPFNMCFIAREDFAKQGAHKEHMYADAFQFG